MPAPTDDDLIDRFSFDTPFLISKKTLLDKPQPIASSLAQSQNADLPHSDAYILCLPFRTSLRHSMPDALYLQRNRLVLPGLIPVHGNQAKPNKTLADEWL